jgi:hypothetical protein
MTRMADNFDDGKIDTGMWFASVTGTGTSVTEQNRRLELSIASDAAAAPNGQGFTMMGAQVGTHCRFLGDFDVSVSYVFVDWPQSNGVLLQLAAWFRSSNASVGRQSQQSGQEFYTAWQGSSGTSMGTLDRRGALRMRRVGSQLASFIRVKGRWTRLWSSTASGAPLIGLQAMSTDEWFADQAVTVAFDNFEIKAAQPVC